MANDMNRNGNLYESDGRPCCFKVWCSRLNTSHQLHLNIKFILSSCSLWLPNFPALCMDWVSTKTSRLGLCVLTWHSQRSLLVPYHPLSDLPPDLSASHLFCILLNPTSYHAQWSSISPVHWYPTIPASQFLETLNTGTSWQFFKFSSKSLPVEEDPALCCD